MMLNARTHESQLLFLLFHTVLVVGAATTTIMVCFSIKMFDMFKSSDLNQSLCRAVLGISKSK